MAVAEGFLAAHEPASSMLLGVCFELLRRPLPEAGAEPLYFVVERCGEILLAGVRASPYGLIIHPCSDLSASSREALVRQVVDTWQAEGLRLDNVLGPQALAQDLASAWAARHGGSFRPRLRMRLYALRRVLPPRIRNPGRLRQAGDGDAAQVRAWFHAFSREALGVDSVDAAHGTADALLGAGEVYLWQEETVTAMVARARATRTTAFLGYAYTPPEMRGRGLATRYIADLSQHLLHRGFERCALFTDLNNSVTNRIYPRVGYRARGDYYEMVLSSAD